ncbi:MipA/OmpV family protein [Uliginosibacterium sp. H1]|uniref:MipA/OmpV family protein n=1 Tax=Uliginosibacterium sp. H1 TaxID=3114757 RepID=UPI002E197A28|nr:MipA/OmpV family protein [Uliginosibacterium sp. H1]
MHATSLCPRPALHRAALPTRPTLSVLLLLVCASGSVAAADDVPASAWSVGLGVGAFSSPFKGAKTEVIPLPYLAYERDGLSVGLYDVDWRLARLGPVALSAVVVPRFQITEPRDSAFLDGMDSRQSTLEAGLRLALESDLGSLQLEARKDVLNKHQGSQIYAGYVLEFQAGPGTILPGIGVTWQSSKLADYYYGVRAAEATPQRPAYTVGNVFIPGASLEFRYMLGSNTMLMARFSMEVLPQDVGDSPIVDERRISQGIAGLIYRF